MQGMGENMMQTTTAAVDGDMVETDNDLKQYKELGLRMNINLFSKRLFIDSMVAHGWYEALEGLYEGENTKKRFIGRLRIFPEGLNTVFGQQLKLVPMFGVDVNAGTGADQLKFFTGFAVRIKGLQ